MRGFSWKIIYHFEITLGTSIFTFFCETDTLVRWNSQTFWLFCSVFRGPGLTPANFRHPAPGRGLTPANIFAPDPGRGLTPAKNSDPDPGRGLTPANFCDPAPGRGQTPSKKVDPGPGRGLTPAGFFYSDPGRGFPGPNPGPRKTLENSSNTKKITSIIDENVLYIW